MSRSMREPIAGALAALAFAIFPGPLFSGNATIASLTQLGHTNYDANVLVFWGCVVVAHVLFALMIFSIATAQVEQEIQFRNSVKMEIMWAMVPILILVGMAIPSAQELLGSVETGSSVSTVVVGDGSVGGYLRQDLDF